MKLQALFKTLLETTNDVVIITDITPFEQGGPRIVYVNPAFEELMGYSAQEVIGESPRILHGPNTDRQTRYRIRKAILNGKSLRTELMKYSKNGQSHWLDMNIMPLRNEDGMIEYYASIERDLNRYKKMERQLANMALFDSLTGALSRAAFMQHAEKEFKRAQRYSRPLSVIMLDIDHFKKINDQHGHAAGDHVLQIFVEAIEEEIRSTDVIGRIGGEEFALLLADTTQNAAAYLAERVRERITKYPYIAGKMLIEVTASLGVAVMNADDSGFNVLLQRADEALYSAKHGGRNRVTMAA